MSSWHRPLTRIYNDNHKFGTSLYSDALDDIEKRYKSSLRNTSFRSDRPDLQSPTIYQNSSIGSGGPACETQGLTSRPRRDRPASMYVESSTTSAGAGATHLSSSSSSVFEKELRQLNSKSTWDLRESRLQVDKDLTTMPDNDRMPRSCQRDTKILHNGHSGSNTIPEDSTEDYYFNKCQELRLELDQLAGRFQETEARAKADSSALRRQMHSEMRELCGLIDHAQKENSQCHKILKRHSAMMLDLQQYCEELEKRLHETHDELSQSQRRCHHLEREIDSLKEFGGGQQPQQQQPLPSRDHTNATVETATTLARANVITDQVE